ncbi:hypothetical protein Tco_0481107 [Tanacetum coccineum]
MVRPQQPLLILQQLSITVRETYLSPEDINSSNHPSFLNQNDHPGLILILKKLLRSDNYSSWRRSDVASSGRETNDDAAVFAKMDNLQNQLNQVMLMLQNSQGACDLKVLVAVGGDGVGIPLDTVRISRVTVSLGCVTASQ